ncbi:PulJ/GspJ family protein [Rhodoferax saidenbachensis]|uniref:Prepilin-type N-terminal cleavage/methylation domain-containing protein n=1 Tax=Rhodoferax saidenbachensis TaxID=1484693 RepID=A0A1P8K5L2_9BURK|nr:prepilin-type N-terminal cleavage/methylation domain-containing protein [Rhodoferax saidenbachensis]APW41279.1 prepilin-type N-terminal cleavage/methylation domain-containing protein [Rhodoferax saidenbachensis]
MSSSTTRQHGFTLIELIMVIVIIGAIGGMVAVFMKGPIDAYLVSGRRAALTDVADTVVRRMARDLHRALPNSIRTSTSATPTNCLQFIPTKTGGRYRATGAGSLDFAAGSATFNMLGSNAALPSDQSIVPGDVIVVYNLGFAPADAYTGGNIGTVGGAAPLAESAAPIETTIPLTATVTFPLESGGRRFHVVPGAERIVSYECIGTNLQRATSNAFVAAASCPLDAPTTVSVIASNVNCAAASTWFNYAGSDLQRNALVSMGLTIRDSSGTESITLQHEVHVSNTP